MCFTKKSKLIKLITHSCRHVAIIMDGNRRWSKKQGKIKTAGYKEGIKSIRRTVFFAANYGIKALTLYAFSRENWNRPIHEINELIKLFIYGFKKEAKKLHQHNIRLQVIGDIKVFNSLLQKYIHNAEILTRQNTGLILNIAVNYSGQWDIVQGVKYLTTQVQNGILTPDQIDETLLGKHICMSELSPVDLVIRTGGEYRISNFLLWQIAYSELYFTDILWPDFDEQAFKIALHNFFNRKRRFGGN